MGLGQTTRLPSPLPVKIIGDGGLPGDTPRAWTIQDFTLTPALAQTILVAGTYNGVKIKNMSPPGVQVNLRFDGADATLLDGNGNRTLVSGEEVAWIKSEGDMPGNYFSVIAADSEAVVHLEYC